ncbi:MAG: serine/threonine-protein kinase [FCB group bacterium]|jgi:serine/threonine protein kinase|nr:serine/threonine-protein kinase [FCB group bacterium]
MGTHAPGSLQPGEVVADRYVVRRTLGKGGMGCVYLVEDRETHRPLALKTLLPQHIENDRAVHRFVREVKAVRQLNHPCIVRIHDARKIGSLVFYTMDYVEGKSLHAFIRERKRLGLGSTVRILSLLCHALEHAHRFTIHRDLSPDNVMILADGSIRLLDFGLAKLKDSTAQFTMIGTSLGKFQYNSPEQRRNAADVDHRTDIYSVGVMFFAMLTGHLPNGPEKVTDSRPDLPSECDTFYATATAHNREDRFSDAQHMRQALQALYEAAKVKAQAAAEPVELARRSRWAALLSRVAALFGRKSR